jgi:hypothetical protein
MMRLLFATMLLLTFAGAAPAFELMGFGAMPQSPNSQAELRKFIAAWESEIWN